MGVELGGRPPKPNKDTDASGIGGARFRALVRARAPKKLDASEIHPVYPVVPTGSSRVVREAWLGARQQEKTEPHLRAVPSAEAELPVPETASEPLLSVVREPIAPEHMLLKQTIFDSLRKAGRAIIDASSNSPRRLN